MPRRARTAPAVVVAALSLLLLAGCSGAGGPSAAEGQGLAQGQPAPTDSAGTPAQVQVAGDGPVLATRTATLAGQPVRADLVLLRRSGSLVQLVVRLTNTGDGEALVQAGLGAGPADHTVSGISLVDTANRKRHVVVRDSSGGCLCSRTEVPLGPAQTAHLSATFAAPPPDVKSVIVDVPTYGAFVGVALDS